MRTESSDYVPDDSFVWPDLPVLRLEEGADRTWLKTVEHDTGRVALIGECYADDAAVEDAARSTLADDSAAITELPGNYISIVVADNKTKVLSSLSGLQPMYYTKDGSDTKVSSDPSRITETLEPDIGPAIAHALVVGMGANLFAENPGIKGVAKMRGRQALEITNGRCRTYIYDELLPNSQLSHQEAHEKFASSLQDAVAQRGSHPLGLSADMSGGLDSSSLAFLAAATDLESLPLFTAIHADFEEGDIEYARKYAAMNSKFDLSVFDVSTLADTTLESFLRTPWSPDISMCIGMEPHISDYLQQYYAFIAQQNGGRRIHMTGSGGDEIAAVDMAYLSDLFREGSFKRFITEGKAWARLKNTSPYELMTRAATRTPAMFIQQEVEKIRSAAGHGPGPYISAQNALFTWLTPDALQATADAMEAQYESYTPVPAALGFGGYSARNALLGSAHDVATSRHYAKSDIYMQPPFLDNDVVKAAFALKATHRGNPYTAKPLLQQSLRGRIPEEVLVRNTKGAYEQAHAQALGPSKRVLLDMLLSDSRLADSGILHTKTITDALQYGYLTRGQVQAVRGLISLEGWLRSFDKPAVRPVQRPSVTLAPKPQKQSTVLATNSYSVPAYIRSASNVRGQLVLFDTKHGEYHIMDSAQSRLLRLLSQGNSPQQIFDELTVRYPQVDPGIIKQDITRFLEQCDEKHIINASSNPRTLPSKPGMVRNFSAELKNASSANLNVAKKNRTMTAAFVIGGIVLERTAPGAKHALLKYVQQKRARGYATTEEAKALLNSAYTAPYLGRIACNEAPWAAAMTAGLRGKKLDWHVGVSFEPLAFHAWVENDEGAIESELGGCVIGAYQSFFD